LIKDRGAFRKTGDAKRAGIKALRTMKTDRLGGDLLFMRKEIAHRVDGGRPWEDTGTAMARDVRDFESHLRCHFLKDVGSRHRGGKWSVGKAVKESEGIYGGVDKRWIGYGK
jgi:hypothetical protein